MRGLDLLGRPPKCLDPPRVEGEEEWWWKRKGREVGLLMGTRFLWGGGLVADNGGGEGATTGVQCPPLLVRSYRKEHKVDNDCNEAVTH